MELKKAKASSLFEETLDWLTEVHAKCSPILGENHEKTLESQINIAILLREFRKYDESLTLFKTILKKQEISFDLGVDDPRAVTTKYNIATILHAQGKYEESLELYKQVLTQREKILGSYHLSTYSARNTIAVVHADLGDFSKASTMLQDIENRIQDEYEHLRPDQDLKNRLLVVLKHNKAGVLFKMGKVQKASVLLKEVWEKNKENLGENHRDTINSMDWFAYTLEERGKFVKALQLYRKVYEFRKERLSQEHPKTRDVKRNITNLERTIKENKNRPCVFL